MKQIPYQGNLGKNEPKCHEFKVLLHVAMKIFELIHYNKEQYLGKPEAMGKWVEKAEHLEVKQRKMTVKYLRLIIILKAVAGKSEPCEDKPAKCLPCQSPRSICCSLRFHDLVNHTFDTCGYGH